MKKEQTNLGYVVNAMEDFHEYWQKRFAEGKITLPTMNKKPVYIMFMSIGNPHIRARVHHVVTDSLQKAMSQMKQTAVQLVQKSYVDPQWMKIDFVTEIHSLSFGELEYQIEKTRKNYFRFGISFDKEFRFAFLEQEINGNAMIRSVDQGTLQLDERNINFYLRQHSLQVLPFIKSRYKEKEVYTFTTEAIFMDQEQAEILELYNGKLTNGVRKAYGYDQEIASMIKGSTYYLKNQLKEDGKFIYGYFSAFAKEINTYNILRHSSSLYALAEGYEYIGDKSIIDVVKNGIDFAIREAMVYQDEKNDIAYMVDYANESEIKLGSNATAILAMAKYMELTQSTIYLKEAQALARGILQMKTDNGGFVHVLSYPGFEMKELHRIIYYEGEAVFALLRLYALDQEDTWLEASRKSLDYFIENNYWKNHDHWLSYAANEITDYIPEEKYFKFGLRNCNDRLHYIYHRDTTYPTFLELTMAAYKLVKKIKELHKNHLLEYVDEELLNDTVDMRTEYQRVGYFYPEVAMYMKNPSLIVNSFFIRHHSFRVRIDDVEHYLSGYCQFLQFRLPDMEESPELIDI